MKRTATAQWQGNGKEGKGQLNTPSGVFDQQPYSFKTRFENENGKAGTNPEELIAAAHAGCFNMALSFMLSGAGHEPKSLDTKATVTMDTSGEHFEITDIVLDLTAEVPGISEDQFQELANNAKANCPISRALAGPKITLNANLVG